MTWYDAYAAIETSSEEEAKRLAGLFNEWTSSSVRPTDFGSKWLANVVERSGIGSRQDIPCCGTLDMVRVEGNKVIASIANAQLPLHEMWIKIAEAHCPGSKVEFEAISEDGSHCVTTNADLEGKWRLNYSISFEVFEEWEEEEDSRAEEISEDDDMLAATQEDIIGFLQCCLESDESDLEALIDEAEENELFDYLDIAEWEVVEI